MEYAVSQSSCIDIETGAGVLTTRATLVDGLVSTVEVDMGEPHLDRSDIPVLIGESNSGPVVNRLLNVAGQEWQITCVSMGNPHCVVFVENVATFPVTTLGPDFEHHSAFPRRTNTEFVEVLSPSEVRMRVWERGAGETFACGTGACAVAVSGALNGLTERRVLVHLLGGDLAIHWRDDNHLIMTGPATTVFDGTI
jgi:diaminopimelate epimerase